MKYRTDIDGLRAFAIIPVILFHFGYPIFNGGFIGVDIFFVLSGYLITKLIFESRNSKSFNLLYFFERRLRRLFPALLVMILFSSLLS